MLTGISICSVAVLLKMAAVCLLIKVTRHLSSVIRLLSKVRWHVSFEFTGSRRP
ncbi:MAG: hypothetical protein ABIT08_12750 [Bacteroidia bacterium]